MEAMCDCETYKIEFKKIGYDSVQDKVIEDVIVKEIIFEHPFDLEENYRIIIKD